MLIMFAAVSRAALAQPERVRRLSEVCGQLEVAGACAIISEAAAMLSPTYERHKPTDAVRRLEALGYRAAYHPADTALHRPTTDLFFASRPGSNRLYVIITGTEEPLDWVSNIRFTNYTGRHRDGEFYIPPGHGGFRGGVIDIVRDNIVRADEFERAPLDCAARSARRSALAAFLCLPGVRSKDAPMETIIVGHSRGVGIGLMAAPVFAGLQVHAPNGGSATIEPQRHWPLRLHAIIGFAPPQAVSNMTDQEAGGDVLAGLPDHEEVFERLQISTRTIMFINERDIVPLLGFGRARHYGHLFRIRRDRQVVYEGNRWASDGGLVQAHRSGGYCIDVLTALGQADPVQAGLCDRRDPPDPL